MNSVFSIQYFSDSEGYFECKVTPGWQLAVVGFSASKAIYAEERLLLRHSAILFASAAGAKTAFPELEKVDAEIKFYFLIVERFHGIGAKFRYAKRMTQLADPSSGIFRVLTQQTAPGTDICYSAPVNSTWIRAICAANVAIGLVCFDEDCPNDDDLLWAIESLSSNYVLNTNLLNEGMPDAHAMALENRKLFAFSGGFDDSWSDLLIYTPPLERSN